MHALKVNFHLYLDVQEDDVQDLCRIQKKSIYIFENISSHTKFEVIFQVDLFQEKQLL
jgi:hypothetical protein